MGKKVANLCLGWCEIIQSAEDTFLYTCLIGSDGKFVGVQRKICRSATSVPRVYSSPMCRPSDRRKNILLRNIGTGNSRGRLESSRLGKHISKRSSTEIREGNTHGSKFTTSFPSCIVHRREYITQRVESARKCPLLHFSIS